MGDNRRGEKKVENDEKKDEKSESREHLQKEYLESQKQAPAEPQAEKKEPVDAEKVKIGCEQFKDTFGRIDLERGLPAPELGNSREDLLPAMRTFSKEELTAIGQEYEKQTGRSFTEDFKGYLSIDEQRRFDVYMTEGKDPGYLCPSRSDSEAAIEELRKAGVSEENLKRISPELVHAIIANEVEKRGFEDDLQDWRGEGGTLGPGQVGEKEITDIRNRFPALKDVDPTTADGAAKFTAAYLALNAERFDSGYYNGDKDQRLVQLQSEWNEAKSTGDTARQNDILLRRYNPGNPDQVSEVKDSVGTCPEYSSSRQLGNTASEVYDKLSRKVSKIWDSLPLPSLWS